MASRYLVAEIPLGLNGLSGALNKAGQIGFLDKTESVSFRFNALGKAPGATKLNSASFGASVIVRAGVFYLPDPNTKRHVVFLSDGRLLKLDAAGATLATLATGLADSENAVFVRGGKEGAALNTKLFLFSGDNQVKVLSGDGTTVSNIATPPADWTSNFPTSGFVFEGRLCGFGNSNDPHRLYFSTQTNHEDFTSAGSLNMAVFPGEYSGLTAAVPVLKGVVLFKSPRGIYFLDAKDPASNNWRVYKLSDGPGVFSQRAVTVFAGNILFVGTDGHIYMMSLNENQGVSIVSLTRDNRIYERLYFTGESLDKSKVKTARMVSYEINQEVVACFDAVTGGSMGVWVDPSENAPRFRVSSRDDAVSLWVDQDGDLFFGDRGGFVWKLEKEVYGKDGQGYEFRAKTQEYDFSHLDANLASRAKNWAFLEIDFYPVDTANISITPWMDGVAGDSVVVSVSSSEMDRLGSFILGTSRLSSGLAALPVQTQKVRITGQSRRIALEFSNTSDKAISISRVLVHFNAADERL